MSRCIFANKKPLSVSKILQVSSIDKESTKSLLEPMVNNNHIDVNHLNDINDLLDTRILSGMNFKSDWNVFNKINPVNKKIPIVSIFGHVDHGKTSLLTALKNMSKIHEVGGITQNISVYNWICNDEKMFLVDTPGHATLSMQREFIAKISDLVIIVIDATKGIEDQTIEVLKLTKNVLKRIICITKIDKKRNIDSIYATLCKYEVSVVKLGGDVACTEVSIIKGHEKTLVDLKNIIEKEVQSMELLTENDREGIGYILDSWYEDGKGLLSKVYLKCGSICTSDLILINGKLFNVRSLIVDDENVKNVTCENVFIMSGINGEIFSGDKIYVVHKDYSDYFIKNFDQSIDHKYLSYIGQKDQNKKYNFICKANNTSQLQVLCDEAFKYGNIIGANVSDIMEADISLSKISNSMFLLYGKFNTKNLAKNNIAYVCNEVIYRLFDELNDMNKEIVKEETILGEAVVKKIFSMKKIYVVGCGVVKGEIKMGEKCRIERNSEVIYCGSITSMMREKDTIRSAGNNTECGLLLKNLNIEILPNDRVISYEEKIIS